MPIIEDLKATVEDVIGSSGKDGGCIGNKEMCR